MNRYFSEPYIFNKLYHVLETDMRHVFDAVAPLTCYAYSYYVNRSSIEIIGKKTL